MTEKNKDKPKNNREHEYFKIQVYTDKTHAILTIWASLAFAILSLIAIFYGLFYEGVFGTNISQMLTGWEGIILVAVLVLIAISIMGWNYNKESNRISDMIEFVNGGNQLPPLDRLHNWKKEINIEIETTTNEKTLKLPKN